jgi:hypothetical protein
MPGTEPEREPEPEYIKAVDWTVSGDGSDDGHATPFKLLVAKRDTWMWSHECSPSLEVCKACQEIGRQVWPTSADSPRPVEARKRRIKAHSQLDPDPSPRAVQTIRAGQTPQICLAVPASQLDSLCVLDQKEAQQKTPSPAPWKLEQQYMCCMITEVINDPLPIYHDFDETSHKPEQHRETVPVPRFGYTHSLPSRPAPVPNTAEVVRHCRWAAPPRGTLVRGVAILVRGTGPDEVKSEDMPRNGTRFRSYGPHGLYNRLARDLPQDGIAVLIPAWEQIDLRETVLRILEAYELLRVRLLTTAATTADTALMPAHCSGTVGTVLVGWSRGGAAVLEAAAQLMSASLRRPVGDRSAGAAAEPELKLRGVATIASQATGVMDWGDPRCHSGEGSVMHSVKWLSAHVQLPLLFVHGSEDGRQVDGRRQGIPPEDSERLAKAGGGLGGWAGVAGRTVFALLEGDGHGCPSCGPPITTFIRQRLLPSEAVTPLLEPEPEPAPEPAPESTPESRIEIVTPGARSEPEAAAMPTPLASAAALAHPDIELSEGVWAGCKAVRTDNTKSRWVTALFGGPMDPSQGPFHAEFEPIKLSGAAEIMFGVACASVDPARIDTKGVYATAKGWFYHGNRGNHYHGDGDPHGKEDERGTSPIRWDGQRALHAEETVILELHRGELRVYMRTLSERIVSLGTMCRGVTGTVRWSMELLSDHSGARIYAHNAPARLTDEDREPWVSAAARDGMVLRWAPDCIVADKDVVLQAVEQDGMALSWATQELRCDKDVALAAVAQSGNTVELVEDVHLRQHPALQRLSGMDCKQEAAIRRLRWARSLLVAPSNTNAKLPITVTSLPAADIIETVGRYITKATVARGIATRHGY